MKYIVLIAALAFPNYVIAGPTAVQQCDEAASSVRDLAILKEAGLPESYVMGQAMQHQATPEEQAFVLNLIHEIYISDARPDDMYRSIFAICINGYN